MQDLWAGGITDLRDAGAPSIPPAITLGAARGRPVIAVLLEYLFAHDDRLSGEAAAAIDRLVEACYPLTLAQLDLAVRGQADWRWPSATPARLPGWPRGPTGALGVLSFSASGHVREAAVNALARVRDGRELPFLLIRLNDWVAPVRDAARQAVVSRIEVGYSNHFVRALPLFVRLEAQGRQGHEDVRLAILDLLARAECRGALTAGLSASDRPTRREAFRLLGDTASAGDTAWLEEAVRSPDTVVRLWAARALRQRLKGPPLRELLGRLMADRFMPVRREALYGFAERLPDVAAVELRAALLDPHVSVREAARFHLRQRGASEFAAFYRERLAEPAVITTARAAAVSVAAAAAGLGETGTKADADALLPFLTHADRRVRRAALRALARLDVDRCAEPAFAAMSDGSPSVVKAAWGVLESAPHLVPPGRARPLLASADKPHARRAALALVANLRWWDGAPLLIEAAGNDDAMVRTMALARLRRWSADASRLTVRPTRQQLAGLEAAMAGGRDQLAPDVRQDVSFTLEYARRVLT